MKTHSRNQNVICDLCHVLLTSQKLYAEHQLGKRHQQALALSKIEDFSQALPSFSINDQSEFIFNVLFRHNLQESSPLHSLSNIQQQLPSIHDLILRVVHTAPLSNTAHNSTPTSIKQDNLSSDYDSAVSKVQCFRCKHDNAQKYIIQSSRQLEHDQKLPSPANEPSRTERDDDIAVLLYYKYFSREQDKLSDSELRILMMWQKDVGRALQLTGRIRIASEGINGTLAGTRPAIELYKQSLIFHSRFLFSERDFKVQFLPYTEASSADTLFPDLKIVICHEIVSIGTDVSLKAEDVGIHLSPQEFHRMLLDSLQASEKETVLLDCRNLYESNIGHFVARAPINDSYNVPTIVPTTRQFSEFPRYMDQIIDDLNLKDKRVMMFCTGGIRCEKGSSYLKAKGVRDVYQLAGGIEKYIETFPTGGLFQGKCFVFDARRALTPHDYEPVGRCEGCAAAFDEYDSLFRCSTCRSLVLFCPSCRKNSIKFN